TSGSPFTVTAAYGGDGDFGGSSGSVVQSVGQAGTTTTVSSSPDPSVVGEPVTFTAVVAPVAPGAGTPTGNVTFDFGDGSPAESGSLAGGTVTVTHTYASASGSPFTVTATYGGDGDFSGSADTGAHTVSPAATTTALSDVPDPSVVGQPVTFTATVAPTAPGAPTATGTVVFDFGDGNVSGPVAVVGGAATTTHAYATTSGSPFTVAAVYNGNGDLTGSSATGSHTVNPAATTTSLFDDLPDPSVVGQPVTFTARVAPVPPGAGTPAGTVVFDFGDGDVSGPVAVVGGMATTTHAYATSTGSPFIVAVAYSGDGDFTASSGSGGHTVEAAATTTTLSDVPDPSVVGQPVTFTATVAPVAPGAGTATGSVVFDFGDGSGTTTATVTGGVAMATHVYTDVAGSPYTVTADYGGDADFTGSTASGTHTVDQATTTATVTSAPDPSAVGEDVTVTATVTADAPGAGTPTGTVTLDYGDGTAPETQTLTAGTVTATHAYADTTGSPYTITATYGGTADFAGDTATVTQVVQ
ncbi:Ig-like domain repeat protein, partial [Streptomyces anandii]|uniref:Ig-like domain repeat protein n=1 Tax=Streptomyces anandii TaxID=285454 RepID=UPI0037899BBB